jgi:hypothetical protein
MFYTVAVANAGEQPVRIFGDCLYYKPLTVQLPPLNVASSYAFPGVHVSQPKLLASTSLDRRPRFSGLAASPAGWIAASNGALGQDS